MSPLGRYNFLDLELSGDIPDEPGKKMLGFIGGEPPLSMGDVERVLAGAGQAENIRGVILRIKTLNIGIGRANSIRGHLAELKAAGKKIIVYLEDCGNVEYLPASIGDKIYVSPWATLNLVGLAAEVSFFKDTLSKLGIDARIKGLGEYKSARDTFTRDSMSPAHREMMESILGSLSDGLERAVAEGRGMSPGEVKEKIDRAPYTAKEAVAENLIDGVAYEGDIRDRTGDEAGLEVHAISARRYNRYLKLKEKLSGFGRVFTGSPPIVAVLACTGAITGGSGRGPGMKTIRSGPVLKLLGRISKDKSVRALVLRISSPGGSGIASDVIREELKRVSEKMPVVVSMSDVAASGGYLVSLGARSILADPMTLTGSIGIVYGKFDVSGLRKKLGISTELMPSSKHSLMYSSARGFTEDEEKRLDEMLRIYYDAFVDSVSGDRNMDRDRAESAAGGRVWTGAQAKELGLVDELGGLHDAIELASEEAGIGDGKKRPHVKYYSVDRGLRPASLYGAGAFSGRAAFLMDLAETLTRESFFAVMPYRIDIR
ncbi:MAG: signal peptide peptidase SppA [Candidatus Dadabacteria bacterium]|nr:signal peptide peptidase SppA [Candidatus Dadabacteria bacterium]